MKQRLFEIIESLEQLLPNTDSQQLPALYLSIAKHLELVNAQKQRSFLNKILENKTLDTFNETRIEAETLLVGVVLNQMQTSEALALAENTVGKANHIQNLKLIIGAKLQQSIALQYNGKPDEAVWIIEECIEQSIQLNDLELLRSVYTYASLIYTDKDLVISGNYAMLAFDFAQKVGNSWHIGYNFAILGYWARENKVYEDSFNYFKNAALFLEKEGADEYYGNVLIQLSLFEKDRENYHTALQYLEKAQMMFNRINNPRLRVINLTSLGRLYRIQKIYDRAESYYKEAKLLAIEYNIDYEHAVINAFLGHLYRDMGQVKLAIDHFNNAKQVFGEKIRPSTKADIAKHLHGLFYKDGDLENAYLTLLDYVDIRLKLQDENRIKETAQLQAKYEAEKREAELKEARLQQTESELKALKAQMNPHFIFNALNSIQEIFFLGDKRLANKHLSNFSQLTRKILHASTKTSITLQEEIETLEQYLALEALRFSDNFDYHMSIAENIDPYLIEVPPMLLQPFVENAIKHGLMHKAENRKLTISFTFKERTTDNSLLQVSINDNGIGRTASAAINAQKARIGQSFASEATEKRLSLLNLNSNESVRYIDLVENGKPAGTEVLIAIPIKQ